MGAWGGVKPSHLLSGVMFLQKKDKHIDRFSNKTSQMM